MCQRQFGVCPIQFGVCQMFEALAFLILVPSAACAITAAVVESERRGYRRGLKRGFDIGRMYARTEQLEQVNEWVKIDPAVVPVHWHELPQFLRRDALKQEWRRR